LEDQTQKDIRSLLKAFGIQADEALNAHIARRNPDLGPVIVRITLEDLTDYGAVGPDQPLMLEVEGRIRHS
jgi:hypothetical protein